MEGDNSPVTRSSAVLLGPATKFEQRCLTLNIPRGGPLRTPEGDFCDPSVTISTNLLLIFVRVPYQLEINIM